MLPEESFFGELFLIGSMIFYFFVILACFSSLLKADDLKAVASSGSQINNLADNPYLSELLFQARSLKLAQDTQWLNLVHYKKNMWGTLVSQAAGADFFLSSAGKDDPEQELEATIRGFFSTRIEGATRRDSPQCQFPARLIWLDKILHFNKRRLSFQKCARFEKFKNSVAAKSATVIFTSYFLNNPSSAFGHSFLRLNKSDSAKAGERYELLDFGINYAADVDTSNPIIYAFKGIAGLFTGSFTSIPFYYKVREYNDFESRDLWAYDLSLTGDQMQMLVAHIWELGSTFFNYFYLSQNCSYHILSMLDVANPELHLTDRLPHFFVIPVETIKVLMDTPGLVKNVSYRPSVRKQLDTRLSLLTKNETEELQSLVRKKQSGDEIKDLPPSEKAKVLDTAIDYVDFKYAHEILLEGANPASQWKQQLLVARSHLDVVSPELVVPFQASDEPHLGHSSIRAGLSYGTSDGYGPYSVLGWRFALHDLLDPQAGYPEYAQIEFVNTDLRYNWAQSTVWLDNLTLFRVVSLSEWSALSHGMSWKFGTGLGLVRDAGCNHCEEGLMDGGVGITVKPFEEIPLSLFSLVAGEVSYAQDFANYPFRLGVGPAEGLRLHVGSHLISMLQGTYLFYLGKNLQGYKYSFDSDFEVRKNFALYFNLDRYPDSTEGSLGAHLYF